jgi:phosphonate transport system permease protein
MRNDADIGINLSWPAKWLNMAKQTVWAIILVGIFVWSAKGTNLSVRELQTGFSGIVDIVSRMFPPDFSRLPRLIGPLIETIQISIWGTTLGVLFAIPLGLLAAGNISPHRLIYRASRMILNTARAIPEMIFAIVFVAAVGLGPFPGVLALAFHSAGMLGKFLADSIEHTDPGPIEALMATGAKRLQIIVHAIVPQIMPEFVSLCLFRWEMNFRSSTILGIVGAGGIGFELITSMRLFFYQQMAVILLAILLVVTMVDAIATFIRNRII